MMGVSWLLGRWDVGVGDGRHGMVQDGVPWKKPRWSCGQRGLGGWGRVGQTMSADSPAVWLKPPST